MNRDKTQNYSVSKDIEQLETLAFHFTQVSKRLAHDREHWADTGKDLTDAVEKLNRTIEQLAKLEERLKEQVANVISEESRLATINVAKAFSEATEQVLTGQIGVTADHLSKVVHHTSNVLTSYQQEVSSLKTWFLVGIILSSLLGNMLAGSAVYYFLFLT